MSKACDGCGRRVALNPKTGRCLTCISGGAVTTRPKVPKQTRPPLQLHGVRRVPAPAPTETPWTLDRLGDPAVAFTVAGDPAPQGSKRPLGRNPHTGRHVVREEMQDQVDAWRDAVQAAAMATVGTGWRPLKGPLIVDMVFTMAPDDRMPPEGGLYIGNRDLSKLIRSTEDALSPVRARNSRGGKRPRWGGVWDDDRWVVGYRSLGAYYSVGAGNPDNLHYPGVVIRIWPVTNR